MSQRSLHLILALALALVASLGCNRMEPEPEGRAAGEIEQCAFSRLETAEEVQLAVHEATSWPDAVILVHVSWAPMVHQRKRFTEFVRAYKTKYPKSDLAFRYIDCTPISGGYEPLRSLPGWKELEELNNGSSLVHGYGELAWLKNGRVLHVERPLNFETPDALIAKTESLGMASQSNQ